jgi:hypothetical protein
VIQKNAGAGPLGSAFYSVKSFELVIICGFGKIEEDQLLCVSGEKIGTDQCWKIGSNRCRKTGSECCASAGGKFVSLRIFFRIGSR